jgi:hypothetical protein
VGKYEIGPARELAACFAVAAGDERWESGASVGHCGAATATSNNRLVGNTRQHIVRFEVSTPISHI